MIADRGNCAVDLSHHVRKPANGQTEFSIYDGRGAGALIFGARSARVLNSMTEIEAPAAGIDADHRKSYFRIDNGKHNLKAAATEKTEWRKLVSVPLGSHRANFGLKQGGGYYAYVASKFANVLVVDMDKLDIVGRIPLDDPKVGQITANKGMGGQGVLARSPTLACSPPPSSSQE
jgi:hypothetical protein